MNHSQSVVATPAMFGPYDDDVEPGAFHVHDNEASLGYMCPCGCGRYGLLPLNGAQPVSWQWDRDVDRPTLAPSIRRMDGCRWHGYLRAGIYGSRAATPVGEAVVYRRARVGV